MGDGTINLPRFAGYANDATWYTLLWLDNDEGLHGRAAAFAVANRDTDPDTYRAGVEQLCRDYIAGADGVSCWEELRAWAKPYGKRVDWAVNQIAWDEIVDVIREYVEDQEEEEC